MAADMVVIFGAGPGIHLCKRFLAPDSALGPGVWAGPPAFRIRHLVRPRHSHDRVTGPSGPGSTGREKQYLGRPRTWSTRW